MTIIDINKMMQSQADLQKIIYDNQGRTWPLLAESINAELIFASHCVADEAHELLHTTAWKPWRDQALDITEAKKEVIDIFTFVLNIFNILGMSADDVYRMYNEKFRINLERQDKLVNGDPV